jgi:hypothetical protein
MRVRGIDRPRMRPKLALPSEVDELPPTAEADDERRLKPSGVEETSALLKAATWVFAAWLLLPPFTLVFRTIDPILTELKLKISKQV